MAGARRAGVVARHAARVEPPRPRQTRRSRGRGLRRSASSRATTWAPESSSSSPPTPVTKVPPRACGASNPPKWLLGWPQWARSGAAAARRPDPRGPARRSPQPEPSPRDPGDARPMSCHALSSASCNPGKPVGRRDGQRAARDGAPHASPPPAGQPSPSPRRRRPHTARAGAPAPAPAPGRRKLGRGDRSGPKGRRARVDADHEPGGELDALHHVGRARRVREPAHRESGASSILDASSRRLSLGAAQRRGRRTQAVGGRLKREQMGVACPQPPSAPDGNRAPRCGPCSRT